MNGPPEIDVEKLSFDHFHPLDHFPGSRYCRTLSGSWRTHLKYSWQFKWHDDVQRPIRKVLCKLGKHDVRPYWSRSESDAQLGPNVGWEEHACCWWCGGERS